MTVIDAATNKAVTTPTGIEGPHNLQVAPDGESVWVVSGHESMAIMIDALTYSLHGAVPTGKDPAHIVVSRTARRPTPRMVQRTPSRSSTSRA